MAQLTNSRSHILVADDETLIAWMLEETFLRAGFRVSLASDGREALNLAYRCQPDLAIINWRMPGPARGALIIALRAVVPGLPIIVVTGDVHGAQEAFAHGPNVHVVGKPVEFPQLFQLVARYGLFGSEA